MVFEARVILCYRQGPPFSLLSRERNLGQNLHGMLRPNRPSLGGRCTTKVLRQSFWYQKNLVPECMAHEQSYWYQFLVPETWAENLDRVPWALGCDRCRLAPNDVCRCLKKVCHFFICKFAPVLLCFKGKTTYEVHRILFFLW